MQRRIVAYLDVQTHCCSSTVYCGGVDYGNVALVASPQMRRQTPKDSRIREWVSLAYMVDKEEKLVTGRVGV